MLQTARLPPWRSDKSASKSSRKASPWNVAPCSQIFQTHLPKSLTFAGTAIFILCFQWVISDKNGFNVELCRRSGSRKISPLGQIAISLDVQWWPGRSRKPSPPASQRHRSTTGQSPQVGLFQPMSSLLSPNSLTFTVKTARNAPRKLSPFTPSRSTLEMIGRHGDQLPDLLTFASPLPGNFTVMRKNVRRKLEQLPQKLTLGFKCLK